VPAGADPGGLLPVRGHRSAARRGRVCTGLAGDRRTAATLVARRICDLLAKDEEEPALSVSVGVASYPKDADTIGTLLFAADMALYAMKDKQSKSRPGRSRFLIACTRSQSEFRSNSRVI